MRFALPLMCLVLACRAGPPSPTAGPLLVLRHGTVWTGDAARPRAESVALEGGRILAVGSDAEVARAVEGRAARTIELAGRVVAPGFIDAHVHLLSGGLLQEQLDVSKATSLDALLAAVKASAAAHPERPWVVGRGWTFDLFAGGKPTRQLLDAVVGDKPVALTSYDGHAVWANSRALALAGVGPGTPSPKDGEVVREADGRPTGLLLERAQPLVTAHIPLTPEEKQAAVAKALELAAREGLTTLCEAGRPVADVDEVYVPLLRAGRLPLRVVYGARLDEGVAAAARLRERLRTAGLEGGRLRLGPLKGFLDGVVESNTAALLAPPADGSGPAAPVRLQAPAIERLLLEADARGFGTQWHAIGDAAVREVLDAVAMARQHGLPPTRRERIEHLEVLAPEDVPRFAELKVIASVMPTHAEPGPKPGEGVWARKVGPARLPTTFAFRSLLDAGAVLAFGSDWPVVGLSVLHGLGVAVTRQRPGGVPPGGFVPEQRITPGEALTAATFGAASACEVESETGVLKEGLAADVVVLSREVKLDDGASFFRGAVELTIAAGQVVYEAAP